MASFLNGVVAVSTVKLQLSGVQLVTERDGLFWFVANVNNRRMNPGKQTGCQITGNTCSAENQQDRKFVDPSWKMELLHNVHPSAVASLSACWFKSLIISAGRSVAACLVLLEPAAHTLFQRRTRIPPISAGIDLIKSRTLSRAVFDA